MGRGTWVVGVVLLLGCLDPSGPSEPKSGAVDLPQMDGGLPDATADAGVQVLSTGHALPQPWAVGDAAVLSPTGAEALDRLDTRVRLLPSTTVETTPCAVPSGSYCDGFAAVDGQGHRVAVDTYAFLGTHPSCKAAYASGKTLDAFTGIWKVHSGNTGDLLTLALSDCAELTGGGADAGSISAPSTQDVQALSAAFAPGQRVRLRGVVTAAWASTRSAAFGFTMQDADGAPGSGVQVVRSTASSVAGRVPAVGDYVEVVGTTTESGLVRTVQL